MRSHLLLILFFASAVSARARNRRDIDETTLDLLADSTNKANHENRKREVSSEDSLLNIFSKFIKSLISTFLTVLSIPPKILLKIADLVIKQVNQLLRIPIHIIIKVLEFIFS